MYLCIVSTWTCNLRCTYCKIKKKPIFISEDRLKKAIDFLLTSKDQELKFEFFGGEPLLLPFPMIKRVILYGEKKAIKIGKKIDFIVTTNGILLDKKKIDFFKKRKVLLILSLDGDEKSHNTNRPQIGGGDSYSLTAKNLPLISESKIDSLCSTVISPETADKVVSNFKHLTGLGFKKIFLMLACGVDWKNSHIKILKGQLAELAEIYPYFLKEKDVVLLNLKEWLSPFRMNTELTVNVDGHLYSACIVCYIKNRKVRDSFIIGDIGKMKKDIDEMAKERISNKEALKIMFEQWQITGFFDGNVKTGLEIAKFSKKLHQKIKKDKKLWTIYQNKVKQQ